MATRLFLTNDAASYTPTTKRGAWDVSSATVAGRLAVIPLGSAATSAVAETNSNNAWDVLLGRWTSDPIDRAGTLSGTVQWIMGALESNTAADMFWHVHIFVTAGSTDTVRGTLLTDSIGATEWPTTATARGEGSKAITSVACQVGDRVCVEIGYRATNSVTTSYTGTVNYGNTGTTDLVSGDTGGNLTGRPGWVEFSDPNRILPKHVGTLTDNFDDNSVDTSKWAFSYGTYSESGGKAQVSAVSGGGFSGYETIGWYALADGAVAALVTPPALGASTFTVAAITLYDVPSNYDTYIRGYVQLGTTQGWGFYAQVNGVTSFDVFQSAVLPGDQPFLDAPWLRITESGGTVTFEVSDDGVDWGSPISSQTTPTAIRNSTRLTVDLEAWRSSTGTGAAATFDNFNLPPTVVSGTAALAGPGLSLAASGKRTAPGAASFGGPGLSMGATGTVTPVIEWSGHEWAVRGGEGQPGPNPWGQTTDSVELDGDDLLLKIANLGGTWTSAEVDRIGTNLGYGRYRWTYTIDVEHLDHKPVLGLYVYDQDPGSAPSQREIDLEITKWNAATETSTMWYSVHPVADGEHRESDHTQSYDAPYTAEFVWESGQVYLRTEDANGVLLGEHVVTEGVQAPGTEQPSMNLWLIDGDAPSDGLPVTARIHSFDFTPGVTHSLVAAEDQADDFSDPWRFAVKDGASITGGELVLPCIPSYTSAYTGSTFDLRNSHTQIEISGVPTPAGNFSQEVLWYLRHDADNYLCMFVSGGSFVGRRRQGGVNSDTALGAHNPTTHRFWRIALSGTGVSYQTSPDGSSWSTLGTATTTLTSQQLSTLRHRFECGHWDTETSPADFTVTLLGEDVAVLGTAALAGPGLGLTATGKRTALGTAALSGPGLALTAAGTRRAAGTAVLSGPGLALTSSGTRTTPGSAALSGPSLALATSGLRTVPGLAALPGPALTLTVSGSTGGVGGATLSGPALALAALARPVGVAALPGPALTLAGAGVRTGAGTAVLGGPALALAASGLRTVHGIATLTGPALALVALARPVGLAALAGPALALAAAGLRTTTGSATLPGPALELTGEASGVRLGRATLPGPSLSLAASGLPTVHGAALLPGPALVLAGAGTRTGAGVAACAGPALLLAAAGLRTARGTAVLAGPVLVVAAAGSRTTYATITTLAGPALALVTSGQRTTAGTTALAGPALVLVVAGAGAPVTGGAAVLALGSLSLSVAGVRTTSGQAVLVAPPLALTAAGVPTVHGAAALQLGALLVAASGTRTVPGSAAVQLAGLALVAAGAGATPGFGDGVLVLAALALHATGAGSPPQGSWGSLQAALAAGRELEQVDDRTCPQCGTPLREGRGGWRCPFDGYTTERVSAAARMRDEHLSEDRTFALLDEWSRW